MTSYIFFLGDADEALADPGNPLKLYREYKLGAALLLATQIAQHENDIVHIYEDKHETITEKFVIAPAQAVISPKISGALFLEILKDQYARTHRLLEQGFLEDFDMLEALHSPGYWTDEREDIKDWLSKLLGKDNQVLVEAVLADWRLEFDEEYHEAKGDR